jgi:hypothetical protein
MTDSNVEPASSPEQQAEVHPALGLLLRWLEECAPEKEGWPKDLWVDTATYLTMCAIRGAME